MANSKINELEKLLSKVDELISYFGDIGNDNNLPVFNEVHNALVEINAAIEAIAAHADLTIILESIDLSESNYPVINSFIFPSKAQSERGMLKIQQKTFDELVEEYMMLRATVEDMLQVIKLSKEGNIQPDDSINIKLPANVFNLADLSKVANKLHTVISQVVVNDEIGGTEEIIGVENGSIWLNIKLGSLAAASLIGTLVWSAGVVFQKYDEIRVAELHYQQLQLKTETIKDLQEAQHNQLKLLIEGEAENVESEHFTGTDPERLEKLKNSIKLISELIHEGAEIKPALNAPHNIKQQFPDPKEIKRIESKTKRIDKTGKTNESHN